MYRRVCSTYRILGDLSYVLRNCDLAHLFYERVERGRVHVVYVHRVGLGYLRTEVFGHLVAYALS